MPREPAEADAISGRVRKSALLGIRTCDGAHLGSKGSLIARSIRVAISAGKTLFAYLGAGCPFRTD